MPVSITKISYSITKEPASYQRNDGDNEMRRVVALVKKLSELETSNAYVQKAVCQ